MAANKALSRVSDTGPQLKKKAEAPVPVPSFDRMIHGLRLGILSALTVNSSLSFNDLKRLLSTTDGNLSVHARKLEEAGYIGCNKSFENRVPKTEYVLTPTGRKAFEKYLNHMEALIQATRPHKEQA
jgi:DNA-binding MarR family transcriptional regulator